MIFVLVINTAQSRTRVQIMSILLTSSHTDSYSSPPLQRNPMSSAIIAAGEYSESADKENALIPMVENCTNSSLSLPILVPSDGLPNLDQDELQDDSEDDDSDSEEEPEFP